jgi:ABC-type multidrug transport system fused ATPase/permease subunit
MPLLRGPFWKSAARLWNYRRSIALAGLGALISAASFAGGLGSINPILSLMLNPNTEEPRGLPHWLREAGDWPWIGPWALWLAQRAPADPFWGFVCVLGALACLGIIGSGGRLMHELWTLRVIDRARFDWRRQVHRHLLHMPLVGLSVQGPGDSISRLMGDTSRLCTGYQALLGRGLMLILTGVAGLTVALLNDWALTLVALVGAPVGLVTMRKLGKAIRRLTRSVLEAQGRMVGLVQEQLGGLAVVQGFNAQAHERRRFARVNRDLYLQQMRVRIVKALASPLMETLGVLLATAAGVLAAWYIFRQGGEPASFITALVGLTAAGSALKPLSRLHAMIEEAQAAADRVLKLLSWPTEPIGPYAPPPARRPPKLARHSRRITFESVSFTYPERRLSKAASTTHPPEPQPSESDHAEPTDHTEPTEPAEPPEPAALEEAPPRRPAALESVSLSLAHGQRLALVGPNGSGKTTLLMLLPQLLRPTSGRVLIDDQDIAQVNLRSLRRQIALVTQRTQLFQGTVAENIACGRRAVSRREIEQAAEAAFVHEFISDLPEGYDTRLGPGGEGLSGGQAQRVSIARAILGDPAILILDEATSQVDAHSERRINEALRTFCPGRTVFLIAHRLSTVLEADRVAVMEAGRLVDQGTHRELLGRCEAYRGLVRTQMQPMAG